MFDTPPENALPLTGLEFPEIDIESPLENQSIRSCEYYYRAYFKAAETAENPDVAAAFRSLGILCSFYPQYGIRAEPYRASMTWEGRRSEIPDDLSEADVDTIAVLLGRAKDATLRARLADILWLRRRSEHQAAKGAVEDYLEAATNLLVNQGWTEAVCLFHRAVQLGRALGQNNEEYQRAKSALLKTLEHPLAQTEPFFAWYFLSLILGLRIGEPAQLAEQTKLHAELPLLSGDPERRRRYLELEADFRRSANDPNTEAKVRLQVAETYVEEAGDNAGRNPPSYMIASDLLARGIEALRQAHADETRVTELKARLAEYQKHIREEMQVFRTSFDASEIRESAAKHVTTDDFREALLRLAMGVDLLDLEELRKDTIDAINEAPLLGMIGETMVDENGRVVGHKKSLLGLSREEEEEELWKRMLENAAQFKWSWRARVFIEPARQQIWWQHRPRLQDLEYLVDHSPFVPAGHEAIFLHGLYFGLAGDFMLASHLLTPQIENSIRYVLEQKGADVSNLNSDLTQPVKTLGVLFELPEMEQIFGKECCFELRGILVEKHGFSFRNKVAHGFVTQAECYSDAALNVWWIVLKLLHCVILQSGDSDTKGPEEVEDLPQSGTSE